MSPCLERTLAEELELQATRAELGLVDAFEPVPVGDEQRFLVRAIVGQGGMGTIYLARDQRLDRDVALKMVAHRVEHQRLEPHLQQEARALAALRHEHVLQVYDLAKTKAGELFIAMEYVPGQDLRRWQSGRSLDELLDVYLQAGRGLAAAHQRGIVHRDFKPDNVLVDEGQGRPRALVGDFGLAISESEVDDEQLARGGDSAHHSVRGLMGTVAYMAPEQLLREPADARSDQHQFCVALWEAIAGDRPFAEGGRRLEAEAPLPPRPASMQRWVHGVLVRGLAFERRHRFVDMEHLLGALERGWRWRRARPWLAGVALGALGLAGLVRAWTPGPCEHAGDAMAAIWSDDARRDVDAAFRGLSVDFSDDLAGYLVDGLDEAAARWTKRSQEVCEARGRASAPDPGLDRRRTCLDRWADRMGRRVERLRAPDPDPRRVARAHELVAPMLELEDECRLPPALIDERVQLAVEESEDAERLGRMDEALALADEAVALARSHGTPCQAGVDGDVSGLSHELAAALYQQGHVLRERSATEQSLQALSEAHLDALGCDDDQRDVDIRLYMAKVTAVDLEDVERAELALQEARAQAGLLPEPALEPRRVELWKAAGLIAAHRGDYEEARAQYQRGLEALGDPDEHPTRAAELIGNIGVTFHHEQRYDEAAAAYDRALRLVEAALGPRHPETLDRAARRALNSGLLAMSRGEHEQARERLQEVVDMGRPGLAIPALTAWAQSEHEQGSRERAVRAADELVELLRAHPDLPRRTMATARITAGQILAEQGDPRGVELLTRAVAAFLDEGDLDTVQQARYLLARGLGDLGRTAEARAQLAELRRQPSSVEGLDELVDELERSLAP
ncbi:MAG: protein kinase [Myxococcales bacterium]|nr:protein kinase [Myxococcales bacterium]